MHQGLPLVLEPKPINLVNHQQDNQVTDQLMAVLIDQYQDHLVKPIDQDQLIDQLFRKMIKFLIMSLPKLSNKE